MRGTWSSLWYKELHEQKWRSFALTCIMLGILLMTVWVVWSDTSGHDAAIMFVVMATFAGLPGAMFIAMGVAAGERANRTLAFTCSLPVPRWRLAVVRIAAGAVSVSVPSIVTWLAIAMWLLVLGPTIANLRTHWQMSEVLSLLNQLLACFAVATGVMLSVYLWTVAVGARQRTEIRAGVAGIIAFVGWAVLVFIVYSVTHRWSSHGLTALTLALSPMGLLPAIDSGYPDMWLTAICLQGVAFATLTVVAIARWGRTAAEPRSDSAHTERTEIGQSSQFMAPRASEFSALAWKQWRDSVPFCAAGLGLILGWTALIVLSESWDGFRYRAVHDVHDSFLVLTAYIGVVLALVVGVGTFVSEVQPGLMNFWRSRPIRPSQWFWTKFLTGLAAVLLFLLLPILLSFVVAWTFGGQSSLRYGTPFGRDQVGPWLVGWAFMSMICMAFSIAVFLTYLVRQAVYAGILSLCLFLGVFSITCYFVWESWPKWSAPAYQLTLFSICTSVFAVAILVLAWQSAVRDWGQKC